MSTLKVPDASQNGNHGPENFAHRNGTHTPTPKPTAPESPTTTQEAPPTPYPGDYKDRFGLVWERRGDWIPDWRDDQKENWEWETDDEVEGRVRHRRAVMDEASHWRFDRDVVCFTANLDQADALHGVGACVLPIRNIRVVEMYYVLFYCLGEHREDRQIAFVRGEAWPDELFERLRADRKKWRFIDPISPDATAEELDQRLEGEADIFDKPNVVIVSAEYASEKRAKRYLDREGLSSAMPPGRRNRVARRRRPRSPQTARRRRAEEGAQNDALDRPRRLPRVGDSVPGTIRRPASPQGRVLLGGVGTRRRSRNQLPHLAARASTDSRRLQFGLPATRKA
jgi:hypothetical protein